ncbi:unnamed protein product [Polarella glacialis]|uniref:C3H1-type domain-containing protein n=1 Tax=Polarella glacialis TaxID=89957 RepID=A0A813EUX5_POLGL|nr:unnamed protein product [Polarella glacialis]
MCAQPKEENNNNSNNSNSDINKNKNYNKNNNSNKSRITEEAGQSDSATTVPEDHGGPRLGQCRPCSFFALKKDGCRQGDDCLFCHACTYEEVISSRRSCSRARWRNAQGSWTHSEHPQLGTLK